MRPISVKYEGNCRKCEAILNIGTNAIYEKHVGLFCPGCEPTDTEEIRQYRQEAADRRADKYEGWASKRRDKAETQLTSHPEVRHDYAFITQPGRIPMRNRMNKADNRAFESLQIADKMQSKADSLRHVRVKGNAEARWQSLRDLNLSRLQVGMLVDTGVYGKGTILKLNKKTAKVGNTGTSGTYTVNVDLAFLRPMLKIANE